MSEPEEDQYELVTPIVLARSNGGPYDDTALVAGMTCGALDHELTMTATLHALPQERWLDVRLLPQVDLIAMRHGYVLEHGDKHAAGYQRIGFAWA
ncbi:hypothetical protein AB0454_22550 [Streptomyces sp. NPDC093509]|uniref:hypothetical protein n=1 Tax=Streptomyces sp. NPDC093509 TaxID=3154982 RepID=UPI00344D79B3